jgi:HEAT repeat protein
MLSPRLRTVGLLAAVLSGSVFAATQAPQHRGSVAAPAPQTRSTPPMPRQKAWGILHDGAADKSFEKRTKAVHVLGLLPGDLTAVAMAEKALADEKPEVRAAGASALGLMLSKASVPKLKAALTDKEPLVILAAAHSLLLLKDEKDAYDVYYAVLTGRQKTNSGLVSGEMKTLHDPKKMAELGFQEGIGFIPFAGLGYQGVKALMKDDVSPVRAAAVKVLADDPDPEAGEALVEATPDKSWVVRAAALDAIARRGDPKVLDDIEFALDDPNDVVRYTAAATVIRLTEARKPVGAAKKRSK